MTSHQDPLPRNLGLDLVRATEAAALSAGKWIGRGKSDEADMEATLAIFQALNTVDMEATLVLGEEGKLQEHSPIHSGEHLGTGHGPAIDLLLDPLDGRRLLAQGYPGAISVVAVAPRGTLWIPDQAAYLEKIVVSAEVAESLIPECMDAPAAWTLAMVARAKDKKVGDLTVFMLERPRHQLLVEEIRIAGARVLLRSDGDITGALMAASSDSGIDLLMGIGGAPEGLISACAVKALGGAMICRLAPQSETELDRVIQMGLDVRQILSVEEMVKTPHCFFVATGVTDGPVLEGVRFGNKTATTNSLILRGSTKTRRSIASEHLLG